MPTFALVAQSMLLAGVGGALATRGSMYCMYGGLESQPAVVIGSLTALCGVFAGFCRSLPSIVLRMAGVRDVTNLPTIAAIGEKVEPGNAADSPWNPAAWIIPWPDRVPRAGTAESNHPAGDGAWWLVVGPCSQWLNLRSATGM